MVMGGIVAPHDGQRSMANAVMPLIWGSALGTPWNRLTRAVSRAITIISITKDCAALRCAAGAGYYHGASSVAFGAAALPVGSHDHPPCPVRYERTAGPTNMERGADTIPCARGAPWVWRLDLCIGCASCGVYPRDAARISCGLLLCCGLVKHNLAGLAWRRRGGSVWSRQAASVLLPVPHITYLLAPRNCTINESPPRLLHSREGRPVCLLLQCNSRLTAPAGRYVFAASAIGRGRCTPNHPPNVKQSLSQLPRSSPV